MSLSVILALGLQSREEQGQSYCKNGSAGGLSEKAKGCLVVTVFSFFIIHLLEAAK